MTASSSLFLQYILYILYFLCETHSQNIINTKTPKACLNQKELWQMLMQGPHHQHKPSSKSQET